MYRVGFVWPALVFGPLWLVARRLWRPLALWIVAAALVAAATANGLLVAGAALWLYVLAALYLGFEGRALEAAALTRRGRPLADIVCAADSSGAERTFFARAVDSATPRRRRRRRAADRRGRAARGHRPVPGGGRLK